MIDALAPRRPPPLNQLKQYLLVRGWQREALSDSALDLYQISLSPEAAKVEIVLPRTSSAADVDRRVELALRTLADIDGVPPIAVAIAVEQLEYDVLRVRLPDHLVRRESVKLSVAASFLRGMRSLLVDAAEAEMTHQPFVSSAPLSASQNYGDRCRMGHTFQGSFGFTIESPVGMKPEVLANELEPPRPFERRVVERVARGLMYVESAVDELSPTPLVETFESGFNANMYERFADLMEATSAAALAFDFAFSPAWSPPADLISVTTPIVPATAIPLMRAAAGTLRREEEQPVPTTLIGEVFRLESSGNPADLLHPTGSREIVLKAENLIGGAANIQMRLQPADYLTAYAAHGNGQRIKVTGLLQRLGPRTIVLNDPSNITIVN
jgi:hypothetical protein